MAKIYRRHCRTCTNVCPGLCPPPSSEGQDFHEHQCRWDTLDSSDKKARGLLNLEESGPSMQGHSGSSQSLRFPQMTLQSCPSQDAKVSASSWELVLLFVGNLHLAFSEEGLVRVCQGPGGLWGPGPSYLPSSLPEAPLLPTMWKGARPH